MRYFLIFSVLALLILCVISFKYVTHLCCVEQVSINDVLPHNDKMIGNGDKIIEVSEIIEDEQEAIVDLDKVPLINKIEGTSLKSFLISYHAFKNDSDIPEGIKDIENYSIKIHKAKNRIYVKFSPYLTERDTNTRGGETVLGREVVYILDAKDYSIKKRYFMK